MPANTRPMGNFARLGPIWFGDCLDFLTVQVWVLVVHAIFNEITATLVRGDRVELRGFGAFSVKVHEARTGRNPRTGVLVAVPKRASPHFRVGKEMKERLIRQSV